jgi:hypothetical protein
LNREAASPVEGLNGRCDRPDCGRGEGGHCSTCGTGGGCSTCGSSDPKAVRAMLADWNRPEEPTNRITLA